MKGRSRVSSSSKCPISLISSLWASAEGGGAGTAASGHGCPSAAGASPCSSCDPGSPSLQRPRGSGASPGGHNTESLMRGGRGASGSEPSRALASAGDTRAWLGCPGRRLCPVSLGLSLGPIDTQGLRPSRCLPALAKGLPQRLRTPGTCPNLILPGGSQEPPNTGLGRGFGPLPCPRHHPTCLTSPPSLTCPQRLRSLLHRHQPRETPVASSSRAMHVH